MLSALQRKTEASATDDGTHPTKPTGQAILYEDWMDASDTGVMDGLLFSKHCSASCP